MLGILTGENGGEGGIRTLGTEFTARRISNPMVSATHPPLREQCFLAE
tara:strand:+ start:11860 stop:12003 length:144 start_codon:yes stop_codon:yes gene_type:complete